MTELQGLPSPPVPVPEVIQAEHGEAIRAAALEAARNAGTLAEQTQHVAQLAYLTARLLAGTPGQFDGEPLPQRAARIARDELDEVFGGAEWPEALETAATEAAVAGLGNPLVEIRADGPVDPASAAAARYEQRKLRKGVQERHMRDKIDEAYRAEKFPYAELLGGPSGFASAAEDFDAVMSTRQEMLVRGFLPADSDVALGATWKAGKSLLVADLVVSLTAGVPFLGLFEVPKPVTVAAMINEGSGKRFYQYVAAVAEHKGVDVRRDVLPRLWRQFGASRMTDPGALERLAEQLGPVRPGLVVVDPWYLSAGSTDSTQLNSAGQVLGNLSGLARALGSTLLITHHHKKSAVGTGAERWTGVGLQEWARVLVDMDAKTCGPVSKFADPTGKTTTTATLTMRGLLNGSYAMEREVWSDDRDDLDSTVHYAVTAREIDPDDVAVKPLTTAEKKQIEDEGKADIVMYRVLAFIRDNALHPPTNNMVLKGKLGDRSGTQAARKQALELAVESGWVDHAGETPALRGGKVVDIEDKEDDTKVVGKSRLALTMAGSNEYRRLHEELHKVDPFTGQPRGALAALRLSEA